MAASAAKPPSCHPPCIPQLAIDSIRIRLWVCGEQKARIPRVSGKQKTCGCRVRNRRRLVLE